MTKQTPHNTSPSDRIATALVYCIFLSTGIAVVLPGILLPWLSRNWHMGDGKSGVFFLCFSVGSSGGALLARGKLSRALSAGCILVAIGATLLVTNLTGALLAVVALYGCGLGLSMTSISLLQSRRRADQRIAELARLNLTWALGASCAPIILLRAAVRFGTTVELHLASGIFLIFSLIVLVVVPDALSVDKSNISVSPWFRSFRAVPLGLLCLILLSTGFESGLSSWLSTYMMRGGYLLGVTISATTAFGLGVVLSRLFHSRRTDAARSTNLILSLHPMLMMLGTLLLIFSHTPLLSVTCAFIAGAGIGPMYPLTLALQLNYKEAGNVGFLMGGAGSSLVPMIIGFVASWTHSLRAGLCIPLIAAALIVTVGAPLSFRQSSPG